jgi:hypothetical protein
MESKAISATMMIINPFNQWKRTIKYFKKNINSYLMSINLNNSEDENYRYKMPKVSLTFGGSGNGIFTILNK